MSDYKSAMRGGVAASKHRFPVPVVNWDRTVANAREKADSEIKRVGCPPPEVPRPKNVSFSDALIWRFMQKREIEVRPVPQGWQASCVGDDPPQSVVSADGPREAITMLMASEAEAILQKMY